MPRFRLPVAMLLAAALLAAGCAAPQPAPAAEPSPDATQEPAAVAATSTAGPTSLPPASGPKAPAQPASRPPKTFTADGSLAAGVGVAPPPSLGLPPRWVELFATHCLAVEVEPGATALLAELTWEDHDQQLTLGLHTEDGETSLFAAGEPLADPPLRIEAPAPVEGRWHVCAQANGVNALLTYTLYGTVFHEPLPPGFTAIPS